MRLLLRERDFGLAWLGGLISMLGGWALWIVLPLYVYELTGSALATSGVVAALVAPGVLLGSVAGVFVDRWDRKTTLVVGNVLLAAATLPLFALDRESRLWIVYPLVFVSETIEQFTGPAENALLPRLVAPGDLVAANSLNALNNSLARLGGPALGGVLYAFAGLGGVVAADVVSFVVAAGLIGLIRASGAVESAGHAAAAAVRRWRRVWVEWREGLDVVRRKRPVAVVFVVTAMTAVGEGVFAVMFAVWVRDVLHGGPPQLGWLQTSQAVGGLIGGVLGAHVARRFTPERLFGLALIAFGVFDLALFNFPLLFDGIWIGIGLMVLVGTPGVFSQAARTTILQTNVEDAYRGRVFGALSTSASLLMLLATTAAGATGGLLGPIALLNFQGGAYVVAGLFVLAALAPRLVHELPGHRTDGDTPRQQAEQYERA
jgi:predicted MFS family arabinose efflux permease